ncbi:MAG: hypothetical protein M1840_001488 [Geoglossum simile]|nr:MAG: hypothetical protein M1840_001488 [Geoglossum simile]
MRLRLNVQRHGLPPSLVVWATGDPSPTKLIPNSTISQLLEKVNDVIPLESDDWGLEDYVVEINGYECLHFQELGSVFRDDEEVCIRPLLSLDLRARKISGRHQISQDGRHLIDGVPFGRPFFRRPVGRPAVEIPPRKRRRLMGDDDHNPDGAGTGRQLTSLSGFADVDLDHDGEDGDESFSMDSSDSDSSVQDDESLHAARFGYYHSRNLRRDKLAIKRDSRKPELILSNGQSLPLVDRDGKPFPGQYSNALLDYFGENGLETVQNLTAKSIGNIRECVYDTEPGRIENGVGRTRPGIRRTSFQLGLRRPLQGGKSVRFRGTLGSPSGVGRVDLDEESDEEFQPDDSSGGAESNIEDEDEASNESSKSGSDSETDSETSGQSSSPSSSESTESEPEEVPSRPLTGGPAKKLHVSVIGATCTVAPGMGQISTKRRNKRRRDAKKLTYLKKMGQLPLNATHADLKEYIRGTLRVDPSVDTNSSGTYLAALSLEAKREELLASIASEGAELGRPEQRPNPQETPTKTTEIDRSREPDMSLPSVPLTSDTPAPRSRATLDIASSRRMLFSSLGFKNPKTKEDEEKLRLGLAKPPSNDRRDQKCMNLSSSDFAPDHTNSALVERPDATDVPTNRADKDDCWKDKIVLKAVECCYDGVNLSSPPFPFRQRWDPHQQRYERRGKGKKRKRNRIQYYEDGDEYHGTLSSNPTGLKEDIQLNYDEHQMEGIVQVPVGVNSDDIYGSSDEQIMREARGTARSPAETEDDLPLLPADVSSLPDFTLSMAQPGTVIAFKQLTISEDWQPHICGYRTAEVIRLADENALELSLARRDMTERVKKIDEKTGERIWGKFEMPGVEDADSGSLLLDFSELIDPKLIRQPQTDNPANTEEPVREMVGEVDPHNSSPVRKEAISWINRRSDESPSNMTKDQGDREVSKARSPSPLLDPVRESSGTSRVEGRQSSITSAGSSEHPGRVDAYAEQNDDSGHDISQLIRDAGFGSTVVSLSLPALAGRTPDEHTRSKFPVRSASQTPVTSPRRPPRFSGLSSSPTPEDRESIEPIDPMNEQFDPTIASVGYPKLPEIESSPRPPVNLDDYLISGRKSPCGEQDPSPEVLTADHQGESQRGSKTSLSEEGVLQDKTSINGVSFPLAGENPAEELPKADSSSSEKDYPSFEELIASGRPSAQRVKEERSSTPQFSETEKDLAVNTVPTKIGNKTPTIKTGSKSPVWSQLPIESRTSGIIDLTASPPIGDETDEDEDSVGLPLGPGWVPKRRTTLGGTGSTSRRKRRPRDIYSLG